MIHPTGSNYAASGADLEPTLMLIAEKVKMPNTMLIAEKVNML